MTRLIYGQQDENLPQLGGKIKGLSLLGRRDLPIPVWIALAPAACDVSEIDIFAPSKPKSGEIQPLFDKLKLSLAAVAALNQALNELCPQGELVAVRSSALDEDGFDHSFAGQLDSFLGVPPAEAPDKVLAVWRSAFSDRVLAYRWEHKLSLTPKIPAVLIQRMVQADISGIAFSADPTTGQRGITVVTAVYGLGTALVSGTDTGDVYRVNQTGQIVAQEVARKQTAYRSSPNGDQGIRAEPVSAKMANRPALKETQVQAVAALARRVEGIMGCPQDIEWAIEGGQLYLLQARPITTLKDMSDPDGLLNLWDNSNIAESYPGLTTPLTFSFARRAYEEVYRQFCRMMAVPTATIAANHNTFRHMLGLIRGRIYYNLLNWYRVLAMLPGYAFNRRFMEQMMGVKESLSDTLLDRQKPPTQGARLIDGLRLLRSVVGLMVNYIFLPRRVTAFYQRLNQALGSDRPDLSRQRPDELAAYYRDLEGQLLTRWDAPLINDFFAMIFYGLLRKFSESWVGDRHGSLQNELVAGTGAIISAEPVRRMRKLSQLAAVDPTFAEALCYGSLSEILAQMPALPKFKAGYETYLDKFGDRCLEELKLESPTLYDDPLPLLRTVGQLARHDFESKAVAARPARRLEAEQQVQQALSGHLLRRIMFGWVLKNARRLIRNRENLRFERTRLFGRARLIFLEFGRRFYALDLLETPRDIFYLEVEEILGFVGGTTTTTDLKGLVSLRKAEFAHYKTLPPPADRFETRGMIHQGHTFQGDNTVQEDNIPPGQASSVAAQEEHRQGVGCSAGLVRGPVRVVIDPKQTVLHPGEVLVARRTDPGWITLFPAAAGVLVEYGSLLSHTAIVSRELGLPAVVSLTGATNWLQDGDWVELDGRSGVVRKISSADE